MLHFLKPFGLFISDFAHNENKKGGQTMTNQEPVIVKNKEGQPIARIHGAIDVDALSQFFFTHSYLYKSKRH